MATKRTLEIQADPEGYQRERPSEKGPSFPFGWENRKERRESFRRLSDRPERLTANRSRPRTPKKWA